MPEADIAKLRRLRAAVSSALDHVPEKSAHGLPPTYNALRAQVIDAVPDGLKEEVAALAPEISSTSSGRGGLLEAATDGAKAHAHLSALKGWLDAVIQPE